MADIITPDIVIENHKDSDNSVNTLPGQQGIKENLGDQGSEQGAQDDTQGSQKKVWDEDSTRALIQLYRANLFKFKDPEYTKKLLCEDIAEGLRRFGYEREPGSVRNRIKTLKNNYRRVVQYNKRHVEKKTFPYFEELTELYALEPTFGEDPYETNADDDNTSNASYSIASDSRDSKNLRLVRKVKSNAVNTLAMKNAARNGFLRNGTSKLSSIRKKTYPRKSVLLYQCGLCSTKFSTSFELHSHNCSKNRHPQTARKELHCQRKSLPVEDNSTPFRWNSMLTLNFLEILKDFLVEISHSDFKYQAGWSDVSALMKKHGYDVSPFELEKKWKILATTYQKTVNYNKRHTDKKKCAFYKRLSDMYKLGASVNMFKADEPVKMTVEVSPFSYITNAANTSNGNKAAFKKDEKNDAGNNLPHKNVSELIQWLDSYWQEWKEYERQREAAQAQRHMEMMEVLACVAESLEANKFPSN